MTPYAKSKKFPGKKTTAFGYFSTICKYYLIQLNNKEYAHRKRSQTLNVDEDHLEHTEWEIHKAIEDFGPNTSDTAHSDYIDARMNDFNNFYNWVMGSPKVSANQKRVVQRTRELLEGKVAFTPRADRLNAPAIRKSLGNDGSMVAFRRLWEKYQKIHT